MGSYSVAPDRWLWFHGAWFRQAVQGPRRIRRYPARARRASTIFHGWCTILVELLGGFAVILDAFVAFASLPMAAVLLVAMFTVHLPYGFSSIKLLAVTPAGAHSDRWAMSVTSSILPASRLLFWMVLAHWG